MNDFDGISNQPGLNYDLGMGQMDGGFADEHHLNMGDPSNHLSGSNPLGISEEANYPTIGDANPALNPSYNDGSEQMTGLPQPLYNIQPPLQIVVTTPSTIPQAYPPSQLFPKSYEPMLGQGTKGPDVLFRIQMGLLSDVRSETDWCLSTLLTFTASRNYELLKDRVDIMLSVVEYVYKHWDEVTQSRTNLDDTYATLELRQKVLEALLILRNGCLDTPMAASLAPQLVKLVENGVCHLPNVRESRALYLELRLLVLEICEHVCYLFPNTHTSSDSVLFKGLVNVVASEGDKSLLTVALRSLTRLMVSDTKDASWLLSQPSLLDKITRCLLIDDEEFSATVLDFLAQFTARLQKVDQLSILSFATLNGFVQQLVRMLTFRMDKEFVDFIRLPRRTRKPAPLVPPEVPPAIMAELLRMDEPERATMWIRSCYETDPDGEVLQVSLWTNYQRLFEPHERDGTGRRMLKAIDFIRTCTTNVKGAQAKVITTPEGPKKFIIKGLVAREQAVPLSELAVNANSINNGPLDLPSATNAPPTGETANSDQPSRGPPVYGNTAGLVLINLAKLVGGKDLISPFIPDILNGMVVNPQVTDTVDRLLAELR